MPGRHAYWVIVDGTTPTSFRAKDRETLVPTLKQLQRTQPAVTLRYFDRGQLWDSAIASFEALKASRRTRSDRPPTWRPGGNHVDPREKYKLTRDQKRARFKKRQWGKPADQESDKSEGWSGAKPRRPAAPKSGSWGAKPHARPGFKKPGGWKSRDGDRRQGFGGRRSGGSFSGGARPRRGPKGPGGPKRDR
jgi:hypothetical protein